MKSYPRTLQKISMSNLAKFTLEAIIRSSTFNHGRITCSQSTNLPSKRKRSNSDEIDIFNSTHDIVGKRRKLNEDGNYDKCAFPDDWSENIRTNIPGSQVIKTKTISTNIDPSKSVVRDPVITLRLYLKYFPYCLWAEFTVILIKELTKTDHRIHQQICRTIYELLFCSKLTSYSSSANSGHQIESYIVVERLPFCRNLRTLEYTFPYIHEVQSQFQEQFLQAISVLRNLRSLSIAPSNSTIGTAYSVFSVVKNFRLLKHFTLFYDSGQTTDGVNVSCLKYCLHLEELALYSFGKGSEMECLVELLKELKHLQFIYHRELPNALMHMYSKNISSLDSNKLKLKSFILVAPKRDFGNQLVYIPISSLVQVATMCPLLSNLVLVKPGNILIVLELISGLSSLTIHSCNFKESLVESIQTDKLQSLRFLRLINTETEITYNDIIKISIGCQKLEELEIFNSNLVPSGISIWQKTNNTLFPFLKKLILLSLEVHSCREPFIITDSSQWVLGMVLAKLILQGSKLLEILYLEFTPSELLPMDRLSSNHLLSLLVGNTNLKELLLWRSPEITVPFIDSLIQRCPKLCCFRQLNLWNFATPTDEAEIRRRYNYLVS